MEKKLFNLTAPQKSIWLTEQFYSNTNINNICGTVIVSELLDFRTLNKAINLVIEQSDNFKLHFVQENNNLKQFFGNYKPKQFEIIELNSKEEIKSLEQKTLSKVFNINKELFEYKLFKVKNSNICGYIVNVHHIISDAITLGINCQKIFQQYSALTNNQTIEIDKKATYKNYIFSEINYFNSKKYQLDKEYWEEKFKDLPNIISIPSTKKDSTNFSLKSIRYSYILNKSKMKKILDFCSSTKISVFNLFMSTLSIYMYRVNQINDFVIGTPILNRTNYSEKNTSGMFINVAPLRINIKENSTISELLLNIATESMSLLRHQKYSYQTILENIRKANPSIPNLYNIVLSYQITKTNTDYNIPYETRWNFNGNCADDIDIHLFDLDNTGELNISYDYKVDKYDEQDIIALNNRLNYIIDQILANPELNIQDLEIATPDERNQILNEFNNSKTDYPSDKTIVELFEEQVILHPNDIAIVFEGKKLTYTELNEKSNQLAEYLIEKGVKSGDVIGILFDKSLEMIISILATLKSSATYLPLDIQFPKERIEYIIKDSNLKFILSKTEFYSEINSNCFINIELSSNIFYSKHTNNLNVHILENCPAYIMYTSGTTGNPKGARLLHKNIIRLVKNTNYINFTNKDIVLQIGTIAFDASTFEIWGALLNGGQLHLLKKDALLNPKIFSDYLYNNNITTILLTTSLFNKFSEINPKMFSKLKNLVTGGEAASAKHMNIVIKNNPNLNLVNAYGPTENGVISSFFQVKNSNNDYIPIGNPISNSTCYIVSKNGKLQPIGVPGELWVGGDGIADGYQNRKDLSTEKFIKSPFSKERIYKTGDMAVWNKNGTIKFLGRIDNQVKIRGFRIELEEINNILLKSDDIVNCTTQIIENGNEKKLVTYIVSKNKINPSTIRNYLAKKLPVYMIPSYFIQIASIPLTINGKIDRKALPMPIIEENKNVTLPREATDEILIKIISDIVNIKNISISDNLFDLGMDSLSIMTLINELYDKLKVSLTVKDVFENSIIKDLSDFIQQIDKKSSNNIQTTTESNYYLASRAQKRIFSTSNMNPNLCVYNICGGIEFFEKLDFNKICDTFNKIVARHESFRTYFQIIDGELYQKVLPFLELQINQKEILYADIEHEVELFNKKFNLTKAPLLNVEILYLEENHTMLLLNMHHIISDGTSMQILLNEFCKLYNGEILPNKKFTYTDFIKYENDFSKSEKYETNKAFWLNEFKDEIPTLNLPTNFTRPSVFSYNGAKVYNKFNSNLTKSILDISKQLQVTPYMFLLSAYYILLYKYTGQENIVIGTPIANRDILEFTDIIGMFVNTLAIRKKIHSSKTFKSFLEEVKEKCLNCFEHQNYPFDELIKDLKIERDASKNAIFDTMFTYRNNGKDDFIFNNKKAKYYIPDTNISKFDLSIEIIPENNELTFNLEYCTNLFTKDFIVNMSNHYIELVKNIVNGLETKISDLDILNNTEKNQIIKSFNFIDTNFPMENNLVDIFKNIVKENSNNVAVEFNGKNITYKELDNKSNSLALLLVDNGIKKGDIINVYLNRSIELIISIWAILKIGAIYMPLCSETPKNRLDYIIQNSHTSVVITNSNLKSNLNSNIKKIIIDNFEELKNNEKTITENIDTNDIAYIIYTSGSTGNPKGVQIKHSNLINFIYAFNNYYKNNISNKDTFLASTNISFDVSIWEIFLPLLNGAKLVLYNEEVIHDIINYTNYIKNNKITGLYIPPNILNEVYMILKNEKVYIEKLLVGVESIRKSTLNQYFNLNPNIIIINGYGPTETTICTTAFNYEYDNKDNNFVSIGKPLYNNNIYILDKDKKLQPIGVPGEIYVTGAGVGNGYIGLVEKNNYMPNTIDTSSKYLYKTGDFAKWNQNGTINFIGRKDSQIKISGHRIELEEIENKIQEFPNINRAMVLAQTDTNNRKYLIAYITVKDKISINKLKEHLRKFLPKYMLPNYFEILDEFPCNSNGKIDKKLLPTPNIENIKNDFVPPRNELDEKILKIFESLLNVSSIGITDNFFELGGDSLLAINLQIELMKFTEGISYADIFLNPTVQEITDKINNINNIVESLTDTVDLLNCNTYIQNYTKIPSSINKKSVGNILLTGSTGYLGIHVLEEFLKNEKGNVYCLLRPEKGISLEKKLLNKLHYYFDNKLDELFNKRIFIIKGDISLANIGLSNEDYEMINNNTSAIINCAAKVSHFGKYELYKKINVDGVQNLIDFCKNNSKTLYHVSTISISGNKINENTDNSLNIPIDKFKENNFFINQLLDNVYVKSKFQAEKLILSEINNGLDAYILRIGNLMGRYSDGHFQQNIEENAYINRLLSFIRIRNIPKYFTEHGLEFTPVDYCSRAIIKLLTHNQPNNRIFHLYDDKIILVKDFLKIFEKNYYKINIISDSEFKNIIDSMIKSNISSSNLNGIVSDFDKNGKLNYEKEIETSCEFSNKYLESLNFNWPNINEEYITKFLKFLNNIYKF